MPLPQSVSLDRHSGRSTLTMPPASTGSPFELFRSPPAQPRRAHHACLIDIAGAAARARGQLDLDQDVAASEGAVRSLRTQCNAFAAVYRLPYELLSRIFQLLLKIDPPARASGLSPRRLGGCITVTHVCRDWRLMACADPMLWTVPPVCLGLKWTTEVLYRAQSAPLDYKWMYDRSEPLELTELHMAFLIMHLERYRSVTIHANQERLEAAGHALAATAPRLGTLKLVNTQSEEPYFAAALLTRLSSRLFSGRAPLRRVSLKGVRIDWQVSSFPGVEYLRILNPVLAGDDSESRPSLEDIRRVLADAPGLKELSLRGCLPLSTSQQRPSSGEPIDLSCLERLSIQGAIPECLYFLTSVTLAATGSLKAVCTGTPQLADPTTGIQALLLASARSLPGRSTQLTHRASISSKSDHNRALNLEIQLWRSVGVAIVSQTRDSDDPPDAHLEFALPPNSLHLHDVLLGCPLLGPVRVFGLYMPRHVLFMDQWLALAATLGEVEHLTVSGRNALNFLCALHHNLCLAPVCHRTRRLPRGFLEQPLTPKLASFRLEQCDLTWRDAETGLEHHELLLHVAIHRLGIERRDIDITLDRCKIGLHAAERLREVAPRIVLTFLEKHHSGAPKRRGHPEPA
jgi:hypothetical protein